MYKCKKCGYEQKDSSFNLTVRIGDEDVGEYCLHCITKHFNQLGLGKVEEVEDDIDWSKVPVDQPVLVCNDPEAGWIKRYYAGAQRAYYGGYTSRENDGAYPFNEMKLDPDAKPIFNWHRWHGGECPVDGEVWVNYVLRDGSTHTAIAYELRWRHGDCDIDIIWYSVAQPLDADGWPKV